MSASWRAALLLAIIGCGESAIAPKPASPIATPKALRIVHEAGRPAVAIVTRDGDPAGAIAAFVSTSGIAVARGAVVSVALAGLFSSRLPDARVTPQADGVRITIAPLGDDLARIAAALAAPVTDATDFALVKRKLGALSALPRAHADAMMIPACEGAIAPPGDASAPTPSELEGWRSVAVTTARVAFGIVGAAMQKVPVLASGAPTTAAKADADFTVYDAAGETPNGSVLVALAWRGDLRMLGAARALGDSNAALEAMLDASDSGAHLRAVGAALSADGACLSMRLRVDADPATSAGAQRIAQTIALVRSKALAAMLEADADVASPVDAFEAAEQAALIALVSTREARTESVPAVIVGAPGATPQTREALAHATADASRAWTTPILESRTRVERGQPAAWMLIASPCGTAGEADGDAGASAAFALAAATSARARGLAAEPWISSDGVGVIATGANAAALADAIARSFLVDPIEGGRAAQGRLLEGARAGLSALAEAIAPGRPASVVPTGTPFALIRLSEPAIASRAESLRRGPLRVAVLANVDAAQADASVARADRWVLREGARACPAEAAITQPKPGTYAVVTGDGTSEAYLAFAIPPASEAEAAAIAGVLDGDGGMLARALGDGLARESSARVLGPPGGRALVVHIDAPQAALDASVMQTRALFDRIRQGAIAEADLARQRKRSDEVRAAAMRDPRERLVALFRGDAPAPVSSTTLDRVRAAAASFMRDDALVIVAARPRREVARKTP